MKKVTQAELIEFLRKKLTSDICWAERALLRIYENQTESEQKNETVSKRNLIGFTVSDAKFFSNVAKTTVCKNYHLSAKQAKYIMPGMGKYARQLFKQTYFNREQLEQIYFKQLNERK